MDERFRGGEDRVQTGGEGEVVLEEWAEAAGAYRCRADDILLVTQLV